MLCSQLFIDRYICSPPKTYVQILLSDIYCLYIYHFIYLYLSVPCLSNFTAPMGTVLSPDYPEGYGNNLNCIWTIISDPGSRIHLSFNDFDLESQFDFLAVKDGDSPDSPILGTFTGAEVPSHLTSNSHILRLEFQADHSMSGRGFNITYNSKGFAVCLPVISVACL